MRNIFRNKKNLRKIIFLVFLVGSILIFPFEVSSQCGERANRPCGQIHWPRSPAGTSINLTWQDRDGSCLCLLPAGLPGLVRYLYEWGIALGGLAAFIALLLAGFLYLTSFGNPARMAEAKDRAFWALGGLVLLLASWLILNTINPALTSFPELRFAPNVPTALQECQTDTDCQHLGANCRCFGAQVTTTNATPTTPGSCLCVEPDAPACTQVELYSEPNFAGRIVGELWASEEEGSECENYAGWFLASWRKGIYPQSSRGFFQYGGETLEDGKCYIFDKRTAELLDSTARDDCLRAEVDPENEICRCIKCRGVIHLFRKLYCEDMMTMLPVTNRIISLEGTVRSAKLFIETPRLPQ